MEGGPEEAEADEGPEDELAGAVRDAEEDEGRERGNGGRRRLQTWRASTGWPRRRIELYLRASQHVRGGTRSFDEEQSNRAIRASKGKRCLCLLRRTAAGGGPHGGGGGGRASSKELFWAAVINA